jgi:hypothetical protein
MRGVGVQPQVPRLSEAHWETERDVRDAARTAATRHGDVRDPRKPGERQRLLRVPRDSDIRILAELTAAYVM